MSRFIVTIILACFCTITYGQAKTWDIPTNLHGDTSLWYNWRDAERNKMKLPNLTKSADSLHFRFWTETQSIDIWTNDYKVFHGILSNFTTEYTEGKWKKKKPRPDKFYSEKAPIDTGTARKVYQLFFDHSVFQIPTDKKIKGWNPGLDGEEFLMEYSTRSFYSFKEYWTPSLFKELKEAVVIDNLAKDLGGLLDMRKNWIAFLDELPQGCYNAGGIAIICK